MSLKVNPVQDEDYGMDFDDGVLTEEEREELAAESEEDNPKRGGGGHYATTQSCTGKT